MVPATRRLAALRPCLCRTSAVRTTLARARPLSSAASPLASDAAPPAAAPPPTTAGLLADLRDLVGRYPLLRETSWATRLDGALADLKHPRRARIAVVGDKQSGASALVTAAFDDPLASDGDVSVALASRRLGDAPEAVALTYGTTTQTSAHEVAIPSPWLRDNKADIVEILHGDVPALQSSLDALYSSDAVVLLLSESRGLTSTTTRSILNDLASKPNLILALNTLEPSHPSASKALEAQLATLLSADAQPEVRGISTAQALEALEALVPTEPSHEVSYEKFSAGYLGSGVPQLKDRLAKAVSTLETPSTETGVLSALRLQTARHTLAKGVDVAAFEGAKIADRLHQAASDVAALSFETNEAADAVLTSLGVEDGLLKIPHEEVAAASAELHELLDGRLAWYLLPLRLDDLTSEIALVTSATYLPHFESHLIYSTGRLVSLSSSLSTKVDNLLSTSPAFSHSSRTDSPLSSLYSPTLLNTLAQATVESSTISPSSLSSTLIARRSQLTAPGGPAEVLQSRAQKSVASAVSLCLGSSALGVGMQVMEYAELATSGGVALLGTTMAAWGLQRGWEKAKKRFFVDVEKRVTGGLEEDLGVAAPRLVERSTYKARTAVALTEELLRKRQGDFEQFKARLAKIEEGRRKL